MCLCVRSRARLCKWVNACAYNVDRANERNKRGNRKRVARQKDYEAHDKVESSQTMASSIYLADIQFLSLTDYRLAFICNGCNKYILVTWFFIVERVEKGGCERAMKNIGDIVGHLRE